MFPLGLNAILGLSKSARIERGRLGVCLTLGHGGSELPVATRKGATLECLETPIVELPNTRKKLDDLPLTGRVKGNKKIRKPDAID